MNTVSFQDFTSRALRSKRITFGDVRRLQRWILPDGISSREEAEALIALELVVDKADPAWSEYLVWAVVDFVVWGCRPTGHVDQEASQWLVAALSSGEPTRTTQRLVREILTEAGGPDEALASLVDGIKTAPRASPPAAVHLEA